MYCKICILFISLLLACRMGSDQAEPVQTGLDRVSEYHHLFKGKRVGIITNHTARDASDKHITDVFLDLEDVTVTALFGPEHGIRGQAERGIHVESETGAADSIPVFSLYGMTRKPTSEMLANVDMLVFDMQDIGTRYFGYIYTMGNALEAAAEQGKPFVVLDRPNPINGVDVEGNITEPEFKSGVGLYAIPVRHGMTVGELARLYNNEEDFLAKGVKADLTVIPMKHWKRSSWYDETGLKFIKPSPNMPTLTTATLYPGTCLFEGVNVQEGRGTSTPFELFGAPWIDGQQLTRRLNALQLPGVTFRDTSYTPISIPGAETNPMHRDRICRGSVISITDRSRIEPFWMGVELVNLIHEMYPDSLTWRSSFFDKLCGTSDVRETILENGNISALRGKWQPALGEFLAAREKYLLYD